nr:hypothetical protein [Neobacillus sp. Marseille-Q6967]
MSESGDGYGFHLGSRIIGNVLVTTRSYKRKEGQNRGAKAGNCLS